MARAWVPRTAPRRAPRRECVICGKLFKLYLIKDGNNTKSYTKRQTCSRRCASDLASTSHELTWSARKLTSTQYKESAIRGAATRRANAALHYQEIVSSGLLIVDAVIHFGISRSTFFRAHRVTKGGTR